MHCGKSVSSISGGVGNRMSLILSEADSGADDGGMTVLFDFLKFSAQYIDLTFLCIHSRLKVLKHCTATSKDAVQYFLLLFYTLDTMIMYVCF